MSLVTIKSFTDFHEAKLCKDSLEAEGIPCFLGNENTISANPLLQNAVGGYLLQCSEKDVKSALKKLDESMTNFNTL